MKFQSINPFNETPGPVYEGHSDREVEERLSIASAAQSQWAQTPVQGRAERFRALAGLLRDRADSLSEIITREMGKLRGEARSECEKCAWVCDYFADQAASFLEPVDIQTDASKSYVCFRPLGCILAVMPWNFPFWQVFRFAAPSLMAGNAAVLKHAPNVPECAETIERLFREAGFPEGALVHLLMGESQVSKVIEHPAVQAVTLTGSVKAGRRVGEQAGKHLKKSVLELGGSDPYVVLEDADAKAAAEICAKSRLINGGQSCIAAKRFIVTEPNRAVFEETLVEQMSRRQTGDPMEEATSLAPMARQDLRDALHRQVRQSVEAGARCLLGGEMPEGKGWFYPPTVLAGVQPGTPAFDEELFGPAAAVAPAQDDEEALRLANDNVYGLGAAVFTRDAEKGRRIAEERLEAGNVFVNGAVRSDPRLPFGGVKSSGHGRELSAFGLREFVNIKTVWVEH